MGGGWNAHRWLGRSGIVLPLSPSTEAETIRSRQGWSEWPEEAISAFGAYGYRSRADGRIATAPQLAERLLSEAIHDDPRCPVAPNSNGLVKVGGILQIVAPSDSKPRLSGRPTSGTKDEALERYPNIC